MKKSLLFLLIVFLDSNSVFAQAVDYTYTVTGTCAGCAWDGTPGSIDSWYGNLQKYWYYRYRLVNDFMLIGNGPGESLPASCRNRGDDNAAWGDIDGYYNSGANCQNMLDWGTDATNSLGGYLSTLAIEYRQLRGYGFNTDRTLYEIGYAQNAFNRLCTNSAFYETYASSPYWGYPGAAGSYWTCTTCPNSTPGFFLRDDVPFLTITDPVTNPQNYKHFNRAGLDDVASTFIVNKACGAFRASFSGTNPGSIGRPTVTRATGIGYPVGESQDQLNEIFIGEGLLCKYLDGSESAIPGLRNQAWNGLFNIINWPKNYTGPLHWYLTIPPVYLNLSQYYAIPDVLDPYQCSGYDCDNGSGIYAFSAAGATDACSQILNSTGAPSSLTTPASDNRTLTRNNYGMVRLFSLMQDMEVACHLSATIDMYDDGYVCFANDWSTFITFPFMGYFNYLSFRNQWNHNLCSWNAIKRRAAQNFFGTPQYPLLYELMHGDHGYVHADLIEQLLVEAPPCGTWNNENASGVCPGGDVSNVSGNAYPPEVGIVDGTDGSGTTAWISEWSGNNMISDPAHRRYKACYGDHPTYASEFNGIDYMELFNLYSYQREMAAEADGSGSTPSYLQGIMNPYYCENYNVNYPDNTNYGSTVNQLSLNWLEYLSAINVISGSGSCPGWVQFRGAKVIDLEPDLTGGTGFDARYGSYFDARIQDYNCHGNHTGDGDYNFATVTLTGGSCGGSGGGERRHSSDSTKAILKDVPIEYLPYGKANFIKEKDVPYRSEEDKIMDSLLDVPEIRNAFLNELKISIIDSFYNDTAMIRVFKDNFGWNADTIAKYKTILPDELSVELMPNPTDGKTFLTYTMSKDNLVHISVSNTLGQNLDELIDNYKTNEIAGNHKVQINSEKLIPGFYIVTVQIGSQLVSKKLVKL